MKNSPPKANAKPKDKAEHHIRPCVMRLEADYLDPQDWVVTQHSTRLMGLHLSVDDGLPYDIAYAGLIVHAGGHGQPSPDPRRGRGLGGLRHFQERGGQGLLFVCNEGRGRGPARDSFHPAAVRLVHGDLRRSGIKASCSPRWASTWA